MCEVEQRAVVLNTNKITVYVSIHMYATLQVYCSRGEFVSFAYVTSLRLEGKLTHIGYCENQTYHRYRKCDSELQSTAAGNVYSMDSICFLICYPSDPLAFYF
jgi:hypothetical protein